MIPPQGAAGGRREAFGDGLHALGEAVFRAVANENRETGRRGLEPAIRAELGVGQVDFCRLPHLKATGPLDGVGGQAAAGVRRDQAQAIDEAGMIGVEPKRQQAAKRDAAKPDLPIAGAGWDEYLLDERR